MLHTSLDVNTAAIELSLDSRFGKKQSTETDENDQPIWYKTCNGFCNLTITRYNVKCSGGKELLGYYCKAWTHNPSRTSSDDNYMPPNKTDKGYWITGVRFNDCFILHSRWGIFPGQSDNNLFDTNNFAYDFTAVCTQVQLQPTGTSSTIDDSLRSRAFCYIPYNAKINIRLIGCIIWDFLSVKTKLLDGQQEKDRKQYGFNYIFDYRRITEKNNTGGLELDSVSSPNLLCGAEPNSEETNGNSIDGCNFIQMNERNYGLILKYVSNSFMKPSNIVATLPKIFGVPSGTKYAKIAQLILKKDIRKSIIFKCFYTRNGYEALVSFIGMGGQNPTLIVDGPLKNITFRYTVGQNATTQEYTYTLYAIFDDASSVKYICFESLPHTNSVLGYDNCGAAANLFSTLSLQNNTLQDIYFNTPFDINDAITLTPVPPRYQLHFFNIPNNTKYGKITTFVNVLQNRIRILRFKCFNINSGQQCLITIKWVSGNNSPQLKILGTLEDINFKYKITNNNATKYTLELYTIFSNSANSNFIYFESYSNNNLRYDDSGLNQTIMQRLQLNNDMFESTNPPDDLLDLNPTTPDIPNVLLINGTDDQNNSTIYQLKVQQGVLTATKYSEE